MMLAFSWMSFVARQRFQNLCGGFSLKAYSVQNPELFRKVGVDFVESCSPGVGCQQAQTCELAVEAERQSSPLRSPHFPLQQPSAFTSPELGLLGRMVLGPTPRVSCM